MPEELPVSMDDLEDAAQEMDRSRAAPIGSMYWELCLQHESPGFWTGISAMKPFQNERVRAALTFLFCVPYSAMGRALPAIGDNEFAQFAELYPLPQEPQSAAHAYAQLEAAAIDLVRHANATWAEYFLELVRELEPNLETRRFVLLCALVLARHICDGPALDSPPPVQERPSERPVSAASSTNPDSVARPIYCTGVSFADVGGCHAALREMRQLASALMHPAIWKSWGIQPARGVLLWGPPGTGKTTLAKALATEIRQPLYYVVASDIMRMWVGLSAQRVDELFVEVQKTGGVLFFDEADALFSNRESASVSSEESMRVLAALNANIDGRAKLEDVVIIYATNRNGMMDEACKRSGRIDLWIHCGLPNEMERWEILRVHALAAQKRAGRRLFGKADKRILAATEGFSGATLAEVIRRVLEKKAEEQIRGAVATLVTSADMLGVIEKIAQERAAEEGRTRVGFCTSQLKGGVRGRA